MSHSLKNCSGQPPTPSNIISLIRVVLGIAAACGFERYDTAGMLVVDYYTIRTIHRSARPTPAVSLPCSLRPSQVLREGLTVYTCYFLVMGKKGPLVNVGGLLLLLLLLPAAILVVHVELDLALAAKACNTSQDV